MVRRPPGSTRTDTLFPDTTRLRAVLTRNLRCRRGGRRATGRGEARHTYRVGRRGKRSEEHTSELQSLMRISYAVFCLQKNINANHGPTPIARTDQEYLHRNTRTENRTSTTYKYPNKLQSQTQ